MCSNCVLSLPQKLETHDHVISTVATAALVLKHQAISIHKADLVLTVLGSIMQKNLHQQWTKLIIEIFFQIPQLFKGLFNTKCLPYLNTNSCKEKKNNRKAHHHTITAHNDF